MKKRSDEFQRIARETMPEEELERADAEVLAEDAAREARERPAPAAPEPEPDQPAARARPDDNPSPARDALNRTPEERAAAEEASREELKRRGIEDPNEPVDAGGLTRAERERVEEEARRKGGDPNAPVDVNGKPLPK